MKRFYVLLGMMMLVNVGWGQISITSTGVAFTENFDGMGSSGTAALPTGFRIGTDWTTGTTATTLAYGTTGTGAVTGASAGGAINWANGVTASATDRSLGFLNTGSYTSPRSIILAVTNNTGVTIGSFDISFDYEKSRSGTRAFDWTFFHGSTSTATIAATGGDQSYLADANNTTIFNPPTTTNKNFTVSGLSIANGTTYYLRWTFTGVGGSTNGQGIGVDNFSVTANASSGNSLNSNIIANGSFSAPANINYLDYQATDLTDVNSLEVAQFILQDGGGAADADALTTTLTNLTFSLSNSANIRRIALYDGSTELAEVAGGATPTFSGLNIVAPDNGTKTFSVRVSYNAAVTDNQQYQFTITSATADPSGSGFAAANAGGAVSSVTGDDNRIEVTADRLAFVQNTTSPTGVNTAMTPAPTVSANDINSNRDLDFTDAVEITSTGTLQGSPVSQAAVAGLATFSGASNLIHTVTGTGLQLTAAATGLTSATSNLFDIQTSSSATDYFRSAGSGDWGTAATWESSPDDIVWVPSTLAPTATANVIRIRNGNNVTVASAASADQIVVDAGGTLTLNANFTLANGADPVDLEVNGTLVNTSGTITFTGAAVFNSGSIYRHNRNGSTIPTATWNVASTVEVTGIGATQPGGLGQTFGNFTWNCPSQSGNVGLGSPPGFAIDGNLTVTSTGDVSNRAFRFTAGTNYSLNIGGNLILNGGHLGLSSGTGNMTLTVDGAVTISDDSELYLAQGGSGTNILEVGGNLTVNTGTITETGSSTGCTILFNSAGSQNISLTSATISNDINYNVASGSTTVLLTNIPVNTGRSFVVNGTLDASTMQITGSGNVTVNGALLTTNVNGIGATGTLANSGTTTLGSSSVISFNRAGAQSLTGRSDYANVEVANGGNKSLDGNATLSGSLTFLSGGGNVVLSANNLVVGGTIIGGSASNYVQTNGTGSLIINDIDASAKIFPIGNSTFNQLIISNGSGHNWSARVTDAVNNVQPPFNTDKAVLRTWTITPSVNPPSAGANLTFQYDDADATQIGGSFITTEDVQLWHYGSAWVAASGALSPTGTPGGVRTVTRNGWSVFSDFAIANISGPLPVNFVSFSGYREGSRNLLRWTTATESNNRGFEVQRSTDGINYSAIGFVNTMAPGGNSTDQLSYTFTDNAPAGLKQYYRLRQEDWSGTGKLSNIVLIRGSKPTSLSVEAIFPNPARSNVNLVLAAPVSDQVTIVLNDALGRTVMQRVVRVEPGSNTIPLDVSGLHSGSYFVRVVCSDGCEATGQLLKQ